MDVSFFEDIKYLAMGNSRQQSAYSCLTKNRIFDRLSEYSPRLAGTVPLGVDLPGSDLDVLCKCDDLENFGQWLQICFGNRRDFRVKHKVLADTPSVIGRFETPEFPIEIFAQNLCVQEQLAWKHMIAEYRILKSRPQAFRAKIVRLKSMGDTTEEAFCRLLGLEGNPYQALLDYRV